MYVAPNSALVTDAYSSPLRHVGRFRVVPNGANRCTCHFAGRFRAAPGKTDAEATGRTRTFYEAGLANLQADTEIGRFVHGLARNILGGKYAKAGIAYDPPARERLSKTQVHQLRKQGLPDVFFGPFGS